MSPTHAIPSSKTASFDVDAQYTFTPVCPTELPVPGGDEIAEALNHMATFARFRVGSKDAHSPAAVWVATPDRPQFSPVPGEHVDIAWVRHAEPGTKGFELLANLPHPADYDYFVWKGVEPDMHPYGACFHDLQDRRSTGVIEVLRTRGIEQVLVGGLATDYCVKTTAMQLRRAGFAVAVYLPACRGIAPDSSQAALDEMQLIGIELLSDARALAEKFAFATVA